ncbi:hypothetical protein [Persicobacter psychrovividus]|uniref:HNH endonuclease n=1 Tax=Persicobacter psychrovividus TaxID=387638 RepID=A0ABM7VN53_9BACT|nr:hypothetical protein PEPS_46900 [Persicobacter psychrovividus]
MKKYDLPQPYSQLSKNQRREVRLQYVEQQKGKCWFCGHDLDAEAPEEIKSKPIDWRAFPPGFLNNPVHLQHDHITDMTEGAVHAYCNAISWQYKEQYEVMAIARRTIEELKRIKEKKPIKRKKATKPKTNQLGLDF